MRKMYSKKQIERIAEDSRRYHEVIISTADNDFYIYCIAGDINITQVSMIPDGFYATSDNGAMAVIEISGDSAILFNSTSHETMNITSVSDQL